MTLLQRAAAIAVALIVVIGVGLLLLRAGGAGIGLGPEVSPTPSPATPSPEATAADATDTPDATSPADVGAVFAEIEADMEELRGLPPAGIGPPEVISREQLGVELRELFDSDYPPEERRADNVTLRAMGLLGPDEDVAEIQLGLLGDQVLGFYDDREKRMVVVSDAGVDANAKFTYSHEYTHALQYAAFPLTRYEDEVEGNDDADLALTSLVEGDATLAMTAWAIGGGLTPDEILDIQTTPLPDTTGIPDWMLQTLEFPYSAGFAWMLELAGDPFAPDFAAVDEAFEDPPDSTEQVLHFEKWLNREAPVEVDVIDVAQELGSGWEQVESTPIGEAFIRITLDHFDLEPEVSTDAAAGWGGDRLVVAAGPDDAFALVWILAWDTPADADAFSSAYASVLERLEFPAQISSLPGGEVVVVHASSAQLVETMLAAVGG
jgi:hypothetical protein